MASQKEKEIGLIAIECGILTEEQFNKVLEKAEATGKQVKEILIESGYMSRKVYNAVKQTWKGIIGKKTLEKMLPSLREDEEKGKETNEKEESEDEENEDEEKRKEVKEKEVKEKEPKEKEAKVKDIKEDTGDEISEKAGIRKLVKKAMKNQASDLHLCVGLPPIIRLNGQLIQTKYPPLTQDDTQRLMNEILTDKERKDTYRKYSDIAFSEEFEDGVRIRYHIFNYHNGIGISIRIYPQEVTTLAQLNMPEEVMHFLDHQQGLILFTGPKNCGKSTTMAAFVETLNQTQEKHIITIEDPIELVFKSKRCNISQREVGKNTLSFQDAIRAAMREDPDVLMLGELRDKDSITMSVAAAETGHLVLGTLQTGNSASTISRLVNSFSPKERGQIRIMLAETLRGVISQRLVPSPNRDMRYLALEVLVVNAAASNFIREDKIYQIPSLIRTSSKLGMIALDVSLSNLVKENKITSDDALELSDNRELLENELQIEQSTS